MGYANGKVFIPATLRQSYGELTGKFTTHNNLYLPATYTLTVLLVQRLDNVDADAKATNQGKGQYFFTAGNEETTEYRPIFGMPAMPEGAFSMNPGNYRYDHANKRMLRNGAADICGCGVRLPPPDLQRAIPPPTGSESSGDGV